MKKLLAIILASTIALTGCSGNSSSSSVVDGSSSQSSGSEDVGTLTEKSPVPVMASTAIWEPGYLPQFATTPESGTPIVTLNTSVGTIKLMLFPSAAPLTVENFVKHCEEGYYDGLTFHRTINDFMIQGGDPQGNGTGGESIWGVPFVDEPHKNLYNFRGAISMANSGYGTNGSQFFIVQSTASAFKESDIEVVMKNLMGQFLLTTSYKELGQFAGQGGKSEADIQDLTDKLNSMLEIIMEGGVTEDVKADFEPALRKYLEVGGAAHLDFKHTVFGQVIEGMHVVDAIAAAEATEEGTPSKPVTITSTEVTIAGVE